jgi:hypothetical protein
VEGERLKIIPKICSGNKFVCFMIYIRKAVVATVFFP